MIVLDIFRKLKDVDPDRPILLKDNNGGWCNIDIDTTGNGAIYIIADYDLSFSDE